MDTMQAFLMGSANRGKEQKVFDWDEAARRIAEEKPSVASAGLNEDWGCTAGKIYRDGDVVDPDDTYTYLASTWATPTLELDGVRRPCYLMASETDNWDAGTYWPESSLKILLDK